MRTAYEAKTNYLTSIRFEPELMTRPDGIMGAGRGSVEVAIRSNVDEKGTI